MRVKNQMKNSKRRAFTLVELLVVIAIIGILFVVLISKVDFATDKAKATGVQTDFRSYQLAIETVARENAGLSVLVDKDAEGEAKYAALEAALNKNLDPKLHVEIDADGKISTKAKDPWKEEYLGAYLAPDEDGTVKDRGAIVMYSKGSNLKLGTDAVITNGVVSTSLSDETAGKDDFKIAVVYTYANGYGEIQTTTEGFSNDMKAPLAGNNGAPATPSDPADPSNPANPSDPVVPDNPMVPDYPAASEGLAYTLKGDDTYEVSAIGECTDTDIVIPATYNGKPVTSIGPFSLCEIWHVAVTSITIPNSVTSIGYYALAYTRSMTSFVVAEDNPAYKSIDGVIYSKDGALLVACPTAKTDITIPTSVTAVDENAFYGCTISSITYEGSPYQWGEKDLDLVFPNTTINFVNEAIDISVDGLAFVLKSNNTYELFGATDQTQANIVIPAEIGGIAVTSIGVQAFDGDSALTSITIPDSITRIGMNAFRNCSNLTSVTFEGLPSQWEERRLDGGLSKFTINFAIDYSVVDNGLKFILKNDGTYEFSGVVEQTNANVVIPAEVGGIAVTSIGFQAFDGYSSLTSVTIPDSVTRIGMYAFRNCNNLTSITFEGKISQWYSMECGNNWSYNTGDFTVSYPNAVKHSVWVFNDEITVPEENKDYIVGFIANTVWCGETTYYRITFYYGSVYVGDIEEECDSALYTNGWDKEESKTITFLEEPTDPELLAWLIANATKVEG